MVTAQIRTNLHRIFDRITLPVVKTAGEKWFAVDIDINCTGEFGATLIYDFNFSVSSIIEISFIGDIEAGYAPINDNNPLVGRQSLYIRVLNGDKLNFRAKTAGSINRIVVGEV